MTRQEDQVEIAILNEVHQRFLILALVRGISVGQSGEPIHFFEAHFQAVLEFAVRPRLTSVHLSKVRVR